MKNLTLSLPELFQNRSIYFLKSTNFNLKYLVCYVNLKVLLVLVGKKSFQSFDMARKPFACPTCGHVKELNIESSFRNSARKNITYLFMKRYIYLINIDFDLALPITTWRRGKRTLTTR